jgi:hypothetical protein
MSNSLQVILADIVFFVAGAAIVLLGSCGRIGSNDITNIMSGNQTSNPPGGGSTSPVGVYDIVIDTVSMSSTGTPPINSYVVYFTDPVAVNTSFTDGYILQVDGNFDVKGLSAMSGKGSAPWVPASSGSHMLAIWDSRSRHSAPYAIVTP